MFIEHDNNTDTQPAASAGSEPTRTPRPLAELRAEYRRNERKTAAQIGGVLLLMSCYFVAALAASTSATADVIARTLAVVIYLVAGLTMGMALRSTVERRKRARR